MPLIKRVLLFVITNIAVMGMFGLVLIILGMLGLPVDPTTLTGLLLLSLVVGFSGALISLAMSRFIALRSVGGTVIAHPHTEEERWLVNEVAALSKKLGLKMPLVAIYPSTELNAFATGPTRNRSLVAVSSGILKMMRREELEGVLGHEMTHVANGDMVTMTLLQGILNTFVYFIARIVSDIVRERMDFGVSSYIAISMMLQVIFGLLASLIIAAFSRHREYRADAGSAHLLGKEKMIHALKALASNLEAKKAAMSARIKEKQLIRESEGAYSATAFGINGVKRNWFSTHPTLSDRIKRLENNQY